jgi:hypothetical protein
MVFARLNGWPIPMRSGTVSETHERVGALGERYHGGPATRAERARARRIPFTTAPMLHAEADTLEGILEGRGAHFPLDFDAHSDRTGVGPDTDSPGNWAIVPRELYTSGVFGAGYLSVTTSIVWDLRLPADWLVMFWRDVDSSATAEHVAVRSDGAKWLDGTRNDAAAVPELVVDEGAVALTTGAYDDLVALPFAPSDTFVDETTRWTRGRGLRFYAPFADGTARDVVGGAEHDDTGGFTGAVQRVGGAAGGCYVGTGTPGDGLEYPTADAATAASGRTELTFELVVQPADLVTATLADHGAWRLRHVAGVLEATVETASGDAVTTSARSLAVDDETHVGMTWSQATGLVSLYIGGTVSHATSTAQPGAAPLSDVTEPLTLGAKPDTTETLNGRISEARFYDRALTATELRERAREALEGVRGPVPRAYAALPELALTGELAGSRSLTVLGQSLGQAVVQHGQRPGDAVGWHNDSRTVSGELEIVSADASRESLPAPLWSFLLAERYLYGTELEPAERGLPPATLTGARVFVPGPFGYGRARAFEADVADLFELAASHAAVLYGLRAVTAVLWVRRVGPTGVERGLFNLAAAAGFVKLGMSITGAGEVRVRGRASTATPPIAHTSTGTIATGLPWHMIGGTLDLAGGATQVFADDCGLASNPLGFFETTSHAFGATSFSAEAYAAESAIGAGPALTVPAYAHVASVTLYPGVLTALEGARIWRAGRRGVFR